MTEAESNSPEQSKPVKKKRVYSEEYRRKKAEYDKVYRAEKAAEIAAYKHDWNIRNNAHAKAKKIKRYYDNRDEILEKTRADYAKDPAKFAASAKANYAKHSEKIKAAARAWKKANRDKANAAARRYSKTPHGKLLALNTVHRRRDRINATKNPVTAHELAAIRKAAKGKCYYCRGVATLTFEHVIPISRGGTHTKDNLVMACQPCNLSKGARDPIQFARKHGILIP